MLITNLERVDKAPPLRDSKKWNTVNRSLSEEGYEEGEVKKSRSQSIDQYDDRWGSSLWFCCS